MLHPLTLEPLDKNPYKHSTESILKLAFTECEEYMAYAVNKQYHRTVNQYRIYC